jgi:DNA-binding CsgD family transcriptional regulator
LFADLARGEGVTALQLALDGRAGRSIRYRECLVPQGYDDELRAVFRSGESTWGAMALYREAVHAPFDAEDLAVVRSVSPLVADALRVHVRRAVPWLDPSAPGLVVVGECGRIMSANREALDWLRLLWPMTEHGDGAGVNPVDILELRDRGIGFPTALFALVAKARAVADGRERGPARLRLRDERGRWIVLHASRLSGAGVHGSDVAIVIEGAKSAEVAPIIIDAYSLTPREREVLSAIARGASTSEIAADLYLSSHTVRDYIKTVFEKLGVSSRGELVARLFAEHYTDAFHAQMKHLD